MPYTAEVSRRNPTCFLFLVDQSGSMADALGGNRGTQKAQFVSDTLNKTIQNLVVACAKRPDEVFDYFWLAVVGYGGNGVGPAFSGDLADKELTPISEIAANPARVEDRKQKMPDGAGGIVEFDTKFPVWFDPVASGGTPMCEALTLAQRILQNWVDNNSSSFPPVVLHITDGESTDGNPAPAANQLTTLATDDGNVLLLNLHTSAFQAEPVRFPSSLSQVPNDSFAQMLFRLSSDLPPHMHAVARQLGYEVQEQARGFMFNADIEDVVNFLDIGTRTANLR